MKILICALSAASAGLISISFPYISVSVKKRLKTYASLIKNFESKSLAGIKYWEIIFFTAAAAVAAVILSILSGSLMPAVIFLPALIFFPGFYIKEKQKKYIKEYTTGIIPFLESIISSMKSGMSVSAALSDFAGSGKGVVSGEIRVVLKQAELGKSLAGALNGLAERVPSKENSIVMSAITTSLETGANLSGVLSNIIDSLRNRADIDREVRALTSQGVMSGILIALLPFMLLSAIALVDFEFVKPLFVTEAGRLMLAAGFLMEITGAFIIRKIVKIK